MEDTKLETKVKGIVELKKDGKFNPQYNIQEEYFDSIRCRCACAPSPGPYCN